MGEARTPHGEGAEELVVQLLRVLSEIDLEELGDHLRRVDRATTRRAVTGATLLAEAVTRAALGADPVAEVLGTDFAEATTHVPHRDRGRRIEIHDDEADAVGESGAGATS